MDKKIKDLSTEELGNLFLKSVDEMVSGQFARKTVVQVSEIIEARNKVGLTQDKFADLLGISVKTLRHWEQGRRTPNKAAQTLIKVANKHPNALLDI